MFESNIIKEDFLIKRAQLKSFFQIENYKKRWFELTTQVLRYFDKSPVNEYRKLKGEIQLNSIKNVEEADSEPLESRPYAFQVVYIKNFERNVLYIIAHVEEKRQEWIKLLLDCSLKAGAILSNTYHPGVWLKSGKFSCCFSINRRSEGCQKTLHNNYVIDPLQQANNGEISNKKLLALFNYNPVHKEELELKKGDEYELLYERDSSWWKAKNKFGKEGFIPVNYVKKLEGECLDQYDWYYPKISRLQSEEILENDKREGVFLVRDSSHKNMYTLSLFTKAAGDNEKKVKHYLIRRTEGGKCFVAETHLFDTISALIYYHMHNCAGLIVRPRFPAGDKNLFKPVCGLGHDLKEIDTNFLLILEELGKGQFGKVNRALYQNRIEVAVKTMTDESFEEDFIAEAFTMMKLNHPNLVKLFGVCIKSKPIRIVTEYLRNGALLNYLKLNKHILETNIDKIVDMCFEIVSGMKYLEEQKVIHRDLAARNCLVDEKGLVKVGDFGLARYVLDNQYMSSTGSKFPVRWSAPEVLQFNKFSSKSDVWAYGVLMWEIFTCGQIPYGKKKNIDLIDDICCRKLILFRPNNCSTNVFSIMNSCWLMDPNDRPSFGQLYSAIHEVQQGRDYDS